MFWRAWASSATPLTWLVASTIRSLARTRRAASVGVRLAGARSVLGADAARVREPGFFRLEGRLAAAGFPCFREPFRRVWLLRTAMSPPVACGQHFSAGRVLE